MVIQVALKNKKESATILDNFVKEGYDSLIKRYGSKIRKDVGSFGESGMQLTGSSPLKLVYLIKFIKFNLLPKDVRLAERKDLESIRQKAPDFFSGVYVDCALNLVTEENKDYQINSIFAQSLAKDLKKVGIDLKDGKLIPYNILKPQTNKKFEEGLVFRLSEKGKDMARESILNTADFKWAYNPSKTGLFRAYLYWNGSWDARNEYLAASNDNGRMAQKIWLGFLLMF